VIGSLITGTHGGGVRKPEIAENLVEITVVTSEGTTKILKRRQDYYDYDDDERDHHDRHVFHDNDMRHPDNHADKMDHQRD